ncbi:uncharacterized protein [Primulina eburnea]|uniref:uncharacterized protein n=1 Tax=Primulina eburnea TaxID=1245227 RepID=UPI003C6BE1AF
MEAEPFARITENDVLKFLWKSIVCRYGVPRRLISDNGRQFQGAKIQAWSYPQSNVQVEVTNRTLVQGLKVRLGSAKGNWVEELPMLAAEIELESARVIFYDEDNDARRATDLDLLEKKREAAALTWKLIKIALHSLIIEGSFKETSR